jgi:hypothetical protein
LFLTAETAECLSLRISDIIEYSPTKDAFIQAIGASNIATLEEMSDLHLYDFGIFIELQPDEEEKAMLENNIQVALQQQTIELEDAIDVRNVRNLKLANQFLKLRRRKKMERDQKAQQENMERQGQINQQSAQAAAQADIQKSQAIAQTTMQLEQTKSQLKLQEQQQEVELKKQLMKIEFEYNMQLKTMESQGAFDRESNREDRKDKRTKIQATQQSELIDQRNSGGTPKNFESSGNDILSGDFNLNSFDPK